MYEFLEYRVEHVMTRRPVSIERHTTLREVEEIFARSNFNTLPVIDRSGRLLGVVTKLDLLKAFLFSPKSIVPPYEEIMRQSVERVITWEPISVATDDPLTKVLEKMVQSRCKSFPVVDGRRLVGMVAREDLIRALRLAAAGRRPGSAAAA